MAGAGGHRKANRCLMRFLWGLPQGETLAFELRSLPRGRSPQLRLGGNRPWEGGELMGLPVPEREARGPGFAIQDP